MVLLHECGTSRLIVNQPAVSFVLIVSTQSPKPIGLHFTSSTSCIINLWTEYPVFCAELNVPSTLKKLSDVPCGNRSGTVNNTNYTTATAPVLFLGPSAGPSTSRSQPVVVVYKQKINCPESRRYSSKAARLVHKDKCLSRPAVSKPLEKVETPKKKRLTKRHAKTIIMFR
jgi:hypothetical protein